MGFKMVVQKLKRRLVRLFTTGADITDVRETDKKCESVLPEDAISRKILEETSDCPQPKNAIQYTTRKVELTGKYIERTLEQLRTQQHRSRTLEGK